MSDLQVVATIPASPEAADQVRAALQTLAEAFAAAAGALTGEVAVHPLQPVG